MLGVLKLKNKLVTALLFGAGARGADAYGFYALSHPEQIKFIGVAEPLASRRRDFALRHLIPVEKCFETWQDALKLEKFADVVINCTQDQMHFESGFAALNAGYDMLIEKPICHTLPLTIKLVETANSLNKQLHVCHVLRFTDFFKSVRQITKSGTLGQIITISLRENVASYHMAHSYVRGNWRKSEMSAPMILTKCCHDLDFLYWLLGEPVHLLNSMGNLRHFCPENAPSGATLRCTDNCPVSGSCPFDAKSIYLDLIPFKNALTNSQNKLLRIAGKLSLEHPKLVKHLGRLLPVLRPLTEYKGWPRSVITDHPESDSSVLESLQKGPYGRCVYYCDNDVVDHQVVNMTYKSGISATLTMHGHSNMEGRTIRIDGSHATLFGKFALDESYIEVWDHRGFLKEKLRFKTELEGESGHGGGDAELMKSFVKSFLGEQESITSGNSSLESHIMAFAAEESRLNKKVIDMQEYRVKWVR